MVTITERRKLAGKKETKKRKNQTLPVKIGATPFGLKPLGRKTFGRRMKYAKRGADQCPVL